MKSGKYLAAAIVALFFLVSACQDEKDKSDYSGISDIITERNKARYEIAKNSPQKGSQPRLIRPEKPGAVKEGADRENEELSAIVLYEENVEIIGSDSRRTLAKGVAYINKKGQIVKIKILK